MSMWYLGPYQYLESLWPVMIGYLNRGLLSGTVACYSGLLLRNLIYVAIIQKPYCLSYIRIMVI